MKKENKIKIKPTEDPRVSFIGEREDFSDKELQLGSRIADSIKDHKVILYHHYPPHGNLSFEIERKDKIIYIEISPKQFPSKKEIQDLIKTIYWMVSAWKDFSLDDPIEKQFPEGYKYCETCKDYEHHSLKYCEKCGNKFKQAKKITWREFLILTSHHGSGPLNTISVFLRGGWGKDFANERDKQTHEEAHKIYREYGGWSSYSWEGGKLTKVGNQLLSHWLCESCGYRKEPEMKDSFGMKCPKCNDYLHPYDKDNKPCD